MIKTFFRLFLIFFLSFCFAGYNSVSFAKQVDNQASLDVEDTVDLKFDNAVIEEEADKENNSENIEHLYNTNGVENEDNSQKSENIEDVDVEGEATEDTQNNEEISSASVIVNNGNLSGLREEFLSNNAFIYVINMRTFNSKDVDGDGVINLDKGDITGTFLNAIDRLDELQAYGINAIHVLPVTPVGKMKSFGNAGSLYAMLRIDALSEELKDTKSMLTVYEQAKRFVDECHKRGISVIFDIPACGSYAMTLDNPSLFVMVNHKYVIPSDWVDVRLFKTKDEKNNLNQNLLELHKKYVDMVIDLGVDGIRADVATMKPKEFWAEIINYARSRNENFLFLAEASEAWTEAVSPYAEFTDYKTLLDVGFDGYYGKCFDFQNFTSSNDFVELFSHINYLKKKNIRKAIIGSFATHDTKSPYLTSFEFAKTLMYLNATLPLNPYYLDGFSTGDKYTYSYQGKKAKFTTTDDNNYYVHKGQIDIFNFALKPGGNNAFAEREFYKTINFRKDNANFISSANIQALHTDNPSVIGFTREKDGKLLIFAVNMDKTLNNIAKFHLNKKYLPYEKQVITDNNFSQNKNSYQIALKPYECIVILMEQK